MTFIVAEIGINWDGDFDLVENMIKKSKEAGCDAIKFQSFEEQQVKGHPESNRLLKSSISRKNIEQINQLAKKMGIEWFCTPMYPDAVDLLNPFVNRFKIRERDGADLVQNNITTLIDRILKTKKEVIVSSNVSPTMSHEYKNPNIKWLYCVPKYPCNLEDLDFRQIKEFDGYSNHCPNIIATITAAILGAKIIEIHITSDKSKNFVDNNVSFDYAELELLVKQIRNTEIIKK